MKRKNIIPLLVLLGILIQPERISLGAKGHDYYYDLGVFYYDNDMANEAISAWENAVRINPESAVSYYNLGNAYDEVGMREQAIAAWEKVTEITPSDIDAYHNMGVA